MVGALSVVDSPADCDDARESEFGASLVSARSFDAELSLVEVVVDDDALVDDELEVSAFAWPVDASATPTPSVIASAPTRPMCLA